MAICVNIGLFLLCISLGILLVACADYIHRAKSPKNLRCGLHVVLSKWGSISFGISGEVNPHNAKDHPPVAKDDGHFDKR